MLELDITRAIAQAYFEKFLASADSDVLIAGAGPSGMVCAHDLARAGRKVVVLEKRLSPGGGVWGGGMTWNEVAIQPEAKPVLDDFSIRARAAGEDLLTVDAVELASALCLGALRAGATVLNLTNVEDVGVEDGRVVGLVVNRSGLAEGKLPIDPLFLRARAVLDATGHDAALANLLARRGLRLDTPSGTLEGEGAMNASAGETFVVERAGEAFPGLFVCGMATCAVWGGPRMGPIFGGMLMSGRKVAEEIEKALG